MMNDSKEFDKFRAMKEKSGNEMYGEKIRTNKRSKRKDSVSGDD